MRLIHRSSGRVIVLALLVALLAACGGTDTTNDPADPGGSSDQPAVSSEGAGGGGESDEVDPLGFRVTAEPGTELSAEIVAVYAGEDQPTLRQKIVVEDEPWIMVFTGFIESATLEVTIESGSEATIEGVRGYQIDPEQMPGPIEVTEVFDSTTITGPDPVVIEIP